ncbi:MAG: chitobiase/beta-hexosaminidase C-terminal domain-containing protein [Treponema sp.]|nr:chitobiase/beta-hexosaminidase C-terminal domain-containing protein [Treponema sp.]
MKKIFFATIFLIAQFALFAEVSVVNPAPGSYANLQTLVLEANAGEEVYYSFSGTDPLAQGFAYDGPVVLDVTGNVELRVVSVDQNQNRDEQKIYFSVEQGQSENEEQNAFLKSFETGPCFDLVAGQKIQIPFSLNYSFFQNTDYEKGREISVSKNATMERFVPINLSDGSKTWRYVIRILPAEAGVLTKRDAPFEAKDWSALVFTDPKKIYSIDGDWWQAAGKAVELDRNKNNFVYCQSADFSPENSVEKFSLPAKPVLKAERDYDGSLVITAHGKDGQRFELAASSLSKNKIISEGLFEKLVLDTFIGDKIEDRLAVDVYSDQVFQGVLYIDVLVNRSTPAAPKIISSAKSSYARDDVRVSAQLDPKVKIFYSISNPVTIEPSFAPVDLGSVKFQHADYDSYKGQGITLFGDTERILAYQVLFYSQDESGTNSATAEYSVIIDKYNYYVDPASQAEEEDGSPFAPFKDLSRLSKIANKKSFSRFFIKGTVALNQGEISVNNNVEFCGIDDAHIVVPANSALAIKNAGLYSQNIFWEKVEPPSVSKKLRAAAKALTNLFILERSAATFKNCQAVARFSGDGRVFNCSASTLSLESTGVTSEAQAYSCVMASTGNSKLIVKNSRLLCIADTAVALSLSGGSLDFDNNFVQITGRMGRPAEFIDCSVRLVDNKFTADTQNKTEGYKSVYVAGKTVFTEDKGNIYK